MQIIAVAAPKAGGSSASAESSQRLTFEFLGTVKALNVDLHDGSLFVSVDEDARFTVVVDVERITTEGAPIGTEVDMLLYLHSLVETFGEADPSVARGESLVGKQFLFRLGGRHVPEVGWDRPEFEVLKRTR